MRLTFLRHYVSTSVAIFISGIEKSITVKQRKLLGTAKALIQVVLIWHNPAAVRLSTSCEAVIKIE